MNHVQHPANTVLSILAVLLIAAGALIGIIAGWTRGLSPIVIGVALLAVDQATRHRR